jgi:lipoprotein-releasing system permease protein
MREPTGTHPFAAFEWMLSLRYLRARRKEGFISVIAGFSFLGIMLGVATLIIVMAVMNGFRQELLDKILGLNGHLLIQPLESPLTDWQAVADRIAKVPGVRLAAPIVEGQALASSPFNASGVLVRGIRAGDLAKLSSVAANIQPGGTLDGFDQGQGIAIGKRLAEQLSLRAGDNLTLVAPRGAVTPMGTTPRIKSYRIAAIFEIGMSEYDAAFVFMPLTEAQAYFNRAGDVTAIEVYTDNPDNDLYGRLAAPQRYLLQRAAGRAQRDVPDPDADRTGRGAQHRVGTDHAGKGQGQRRRYPAHHGGHARRDHAHLPHHRSLDRVRRHARRFSARYRDLP